jgi:hypothetical protein
VKSPEERNVSNHGTITQHHQPQSCAKSAVSVLFRSRTLISIRSPFLSSIIMQHTLNIECAIEIYCIAGVCIEGGSAAAAAAEHYKVSYKFY